MILAKVAPAFFFQAEDGIRDIVGRDGSNGVSRAADDRAFDSFTDLSQHVTQTRTFSALIESFVERGQCSKAPDTEKVDRSCYQESSTWVKWSSNPHPGASTELDFHQIPSLLLVYYCGSSARSGIGCAVRVE